MPGFLLQPPRLPSQPPPLSSAALIQSRKGRGRRQWLPAGSPGWNHWSHTPQSWGQVHLLPLTCLVHIWTNHWFPLWASVYPSMKWGGHNNLWDRSRPCPLWVLCDSPQPPPHPFFSPGLLHSLNLPAWPLEEPEFSPSDSDFTSHHMPKSVPDGLKK